MKRDPFAAIADPTRRAIIHILSASPLTVNQVADHFSDISRQAVSKQLRHLQRSGFVKMMDIGRERHCHLQAAAFRALNEYVQQYSHLWDDGTAISVAPTPAPQPIADTPPVPVPEVESASPKPAARKRTAGGKKKADNSDDKSQLSMFDF